MLTYNNLNFAKHEKELSNASLENAGSFHGYYKATKRGFYLFDLKNELRAFIRTVKEPMLMSATKMVDGKTWYSYTGTLDEIWLKIREKNGDRIVSYIDEQNLIKDIKHV